MTSYFLIINIIFILVVSNAWCQRTEQIIVEYGQIFSFDCKQDESVYFGRRLDQWSDIKENNNNKYSYLNLKFNILNEDNILRVRSDSAQSEHIGYYACGKSTSKTRIYQLILADVQSFYWTYICHGSPGSCIRSDDPNDENLSTFEVADQTNIDLFCCASVTGYKNININMNEIGQIRGEIHIKRKQELDESWVICANQHTYLTRTSFRRQQTLTCELIIDDRSYSTLSSVIVMKDPMPIDPDIDSPSDYTPPPRDGSNNNEFFNNQKPLNDGKLTTGKKIAIIIGSIIGGLLLFGLLFGLIFCLYCKKKASKKNSKPINDSHEYSKPNTYDKPKQSNEEEEEEYHYIEPTPYYANIPINLRL